MTMRELCSEKRFVGAVAVSSKAAIEEASPTQVVTTSGQTYIGYLQENRRAAQRPNLG